MFRQKAFLATRQLVKWLNEPMTPYLPKDPHQLIAALSRDRVSLELNTFDLCCLVSLALRAERDTLASFDGDTLSDLFEQVCEVVEPEAENPRKRATHAIQHLRDQRMLARIDGAGMVRAGEFALTGFATALVKHLIDDEALTRENLTLLTRTLLAQLAALKSEATRASSTEAWQENVIAPLRITVSDLVAGIDRRQRGLDTAQAEVQREIAEMLKEQWFTGIGQAQALLDETTRTLTEITEVLLRDTPQFTSLLLDIQMLAERAGVLEAQEAAQRVANELDRVAVWGSVRQRTWSDYYQYVHRYVRDVVRIDPERALSQRLRDQLVRWVEARFHLVTAEPTSITLLSDVSPALERPAVTRPRTVRDVAPAPVTPDDAELDLTPLVHAALVAGAVSLAEVTSQVLTALPEARRFAAAGQVAACVARVTRPLADRERPWVSVCETFEIEDWGLVPGRRKP
jgi:chromosome partition protein MukF